jgi:hypothetical protein
VGVYLPFLVHSLATTDPTPRLSAARLTAVFYVAVHSLNGHKELRFLLPVLPLLLLDASASAERLNLKRDGRLLGALRAVNLLAFLFFSLVWQSGSIYSMYQIGSLIPPDATAVSVDLVTSCHATPAHTHLFRPGLRADVRFVDCHVDCRRDDSCAHDRYNEDPAGFVRAWDWAKGADFVVTENNWEVMEGQVGGYELVGSWWDRPGEYKVVWRRAGYSGEGAGVGAGLGAGVGVGVGGEL